MHVLNINQLFYRINNYFKFYFINLMKNQEDPFIQNYLQFNLITNFVLKLNFFNYLY